jgi:hypothetical protein
MELKYIDFSFERKEPKTIETGIYVDCCFWLGIMYRYYLKPVISDKMILFKIIVTETSNDKVEKPVSKYHSEGAHIYLYIKYDHKNLLDKPFAEVQKILLDLIHGRIIKYAAENNLDKEIFQDAYNSIIESNFLFEKKYSNPASNNIYTAQITFKFDFQNTGVLYNCIFVEIYKDSQLFNKIKLLGDALFAAHYPMIEKDIEWIDEENMEIFLCSNVFPGGIFRRQDNYWIVNINGSISYETTDKYNSSKIFDLGMEYYKGKMVAMNKEKGYELINKAAKMGNYYAREWLCRYNYDSDYPFWIPPNI